MDGADHAIAWLRRALPWLTILVLVAAIYDGVVLYSRWRRQQVAERAQLRMGAEQTRKILDGLGGSTLRILSFYATPTVVGPGRPASICYGVNGAKTVRIEPPIGPIWPAVSRCVQVAPRQDTEYMLVAADAAGHSASQKLVLKVAR